MSSVRMCDQCGTIFAEGIEGSSTGQVTVMVKDDRGITRPVTRVMDYGPECSKSGEVQPRLAIRGSLTDD